MRGGSLSAVLSFGFRYLCACASVNLLRAKFDFACAWIFLLRGCVDTKEIKFD